MFKALARWINLETKTDAKVADRLLIKTATETRVECRRLLKETKQAVIALQKELEGIAAKLNK